MSSVNNLISTSPSPRAPSPPPEDAPRKKRRRAAGKSTFIKPENSNQQLFEKGDWYFDGPYRRVPPYFFVHDHVYEFDGRHIIRGRRSAGEVSRC